LLDKAIYFFYLFPLIFSPLAFGTVEPWSLAILELSVFFILLLLSFRNFHSPAGHFFYPPGMLPLLILLLYILFQLVPLPLDIVRFISPETHNIYRQTTGQSDISSWTSLSLNKSSTLSEFFRISSYVAFYFVTVQLLSKKENSRKTMTIIVAFAALYAFFALIQHSLPNGKIYWLRSFPKGALPFGSYINRNHFSGLMEMIFPLAIALFLYYKPAIDRDSIKEKMRQFLLHERINDHALFGLASMVIALSVFLSLSRGAILSLSLAMFLMGLFMVLKKEKLQNGLIIMAFSFFTFSIFGWFGWDMLFARFYSIRDSYGHITDLRALIWQNVTLIIKDFPVTGTGFGSFASVFPKYRSMSDNYIIDHAHNDYLELISNGGIVALLLLSSFILSLFYKSFLSIKTKRNHYAIYTCIGSIAGILSILLHSLTDFNLHIGANGLYFFFLSGIAVTASGSRLTSEVEFPLKKPLPFTPKTIVIVFFLFFFTSFAYKASLFISHFYLTKSKMHALISNENKASSSSEKWLGKAAFLNPLDSEVFSLMAHIQNRKGDNIKALKYINHAIAKDTLNASLLQQKGLILTLLGNKNEANAFLKLGTVYDKTNPIKHESYAFWLLNENREDEAVHYFRKAISLEPEHTRKYITYLTLRKRSIDYILKVLPERVEPHINLAHYLDATGREKNAIEVMTKALVFIKYEKKAKPDFFIKIHDFFRGKKRHDQALYVMKKAVEFRPDDARIRFLSGRAYEEAGITYRAIEEYKRTLILDPGRKSARKRIDYLEK